MTDTHDPRLRELTYKLMHMAPQAPPFPEAPVTTLKPQKSTKPMAPQRRSWRAAAVAAGAFVLALLVAVPVLLLDRGGESPVGPSTTGPAVTTSVPPVTSVPPQQSSVTLYFLADYVEGANLPGPHLVAVRRMVDVAEPTDAHNTIFAAISAIIDGPTAADEDAVPGISSSVPPAAELIGMTLDNTTSIGRLTLDFDRVIESGGGTFSMTSRLAQLVYTATQFPEVDEVAFTIESEPVAVFSGEGLVLDGPQTRDDYRDILPLIFVESPLPATATGSPVHVTGVANTFEAGLEYRIETGDGAVLTEGFATASCGTGCWGDFDIEVNYTLNETTTGYVVLFESSAQDGRPVNVVRVPVTLTAAPGATVEAIGNVLGGLPLDGSVVVESPIVVSGTIGGLVGELTVNGQPVVVSGDYFETSLDLAPGPNEVVFDGRNVHEVYTVTYMPDATVEFAFLTRVSQTEVVADYAQWLTGDAANQAAFEDGVISSVAEGVPNDYYIRNDNPQLRTLALANDVIVSLPTSAPGPVGMVTVAPAEWFGLFKLDGTTWDVDSGDEPPLFGEPHFGYFGASNVGFAYWLTLDAEGSVVQITGQYRP